MIKTNPVFFNGGNIFIKGNVNRLQGELILTPSGTVGVTITTKGFRKRDGSFDTGASAIFLGEGRFGDPATAFLVGSSSLGPVMSLGDRFTAEMSGSRFVITVSGTLLVETTPNVFTDVREVIGSGSALSALYAIETATNSLVSSSLNLAYSSSLTSASLTAVSAALAQKEVADQFALTSSIIAASASLISTSIAYSASLAAALTAVSSAFVQTTSSIAVVDAANKIVLSTSVKSDSGLYLESSSMGFYNALQNQYPVVINSIGQFRFADSASFVGGSDPYTNLVGFANGAFLVRTDKLMLQTPSLVLIGANTASGAGNVFRLGPSATTMSFTDKLGSYLDGAGNFRVGTDTTGSEFLQFGPASGLVIKSKRLVLDAGGIYATADTSSASTGHQLKIGVNAGGLTLVSGSGFYVDGGGNIRAGDPAGSFFEFTPTNAFRLKTTKLEISAGGLYMLGHPASGSLNTFKLGVNASGITGTSGSGVYLDGGGTFRVGKSVGAGDYFYFDTNAIFISSSNFFLNAGSGGNNLQLNQFQLILGNSTSPGTWPFPYNSSTFRGLYADNQGQIFVGDAATNYIQFGGQVIELKANAFVLRTPGFQFSSSFSGSGGDLRAGSATALNSGVGGWLGGDGTFRAGNPAGAQVKWDGSTLTVSGSINITGGNAATQTYAISTATNATATASINDTALSGSISSSFINSPIGLIVRAVAPAGSGLYLGSDKLGFYNGSAFKTYMDSSGHFFLSGAGGDSLSWDGTTLSIAGSISITGGNAATQTYANSAASTAESNAENFATTGDTNLSSSVASNIFTNTAGSIIKSPSPSGTGLFIGSTFLGYYTGGAWTSYIDNAGNFQFKGDANNFIQWNGSTFTVKASVLLLNSTNIKIDSAGNYIGIGGATTYAGSTGIWIGMNGSTPTARFGGNTYITTTRVSVDNLSSQTLSGGDVSADNKDLLVRGGTGGNLYFGADLQTKWYIGHTSFAFGPVSDGLCDIGQSSDFRPDNAYIKTSVYASSFFTTSKRELKEDILPFDDSALDLIRDVKLWSYRYKDDKTRIPKIGFMADDTHTLFAGPKRENFDHGNTISLLLKAVQELEAKIVRLEGKK